MHGTSLLRRLGAQVGCALVLLSLTAVHAATASAGLDFGYSVNGPSAVRPVLVFNDGTDTYVQPADGVATTLKGAVRDGPYLRVAGLPDALKVQAGRYSMDVTRSAAPNAPQGGDMYAMRKSPEHAQATAAPGGPMALGPNETALSNRAVAALTTPSAPPLLASTMRVAAASPGNAPRLASTPPTESETVGHTITVDQTASVGLDQVVGKAGIEVVSAANGMLTVTLRSTPKTMFVVDRSDNSDIAVSWANPTSFSIPVREKVEITLDSKTVDLTHVLGNRYVVALQPTAGNITK
jgi:hypothetical protein